MPFTKKREKKGKKGKKRKKEKRGKGFLKKVAPLSATSVNRLALTDRSLAEIG